MNDISMAKKMSIISFTWKIRIGVLILTSISCLSLALYQFSKNDMKYLFLGITNKHMPSAIIVENINSQGNAFLEYGAGLYRQYVLGQNLGELPDNIEIDPGLSELQKKVLDGINALAVMNVSNALLVDLGNDIQKYQDDIQEYRRAKLRIGQSQQALNDKMALLHAARNRYAVLTTALGDGPIFNLLADLEQTYKKRSKNALQDIRQTVWENTSILRTLASADADAVLAYALLTRASTASSIEDIDLLKTDFQAILARLKNNSGDANLTALKDLKAAADSLFAFGKGETSLFAMRLQNLHHKNQLAQLSQDIQNDKARLRQELSGLVIQAHQAFQEDRQNTQDQLELKWSLLVVALFLSILLALWIGWWGISWRMGRSFGLIVQASRQKLAGEPLPDLSALPKSNDFFVIGEALQLTEDEIVRTKSEMMDETVVVHDATDKGSEAE